MTRTYLVVYAKSAGSNFSGCSPDVPGCISAGDTLEEMRAMMREAIESHFDLLAELGDPIPGPETTYVNFNKEDFEGVDYFVVEMLDVRIPEVTAKRKRLTA
jgi:predicted RNase H-like HicB family nuclease